MKPEPTIREFIDVATGAVRGSKDEMADTRQGSIYEHIFGPSAILWSRQAQRHTDLFAATRFDGAQSDDLTDLIAGRFQIDRNLDAPGTGIAQFTRPTAAAGAGTIYRGTKIFVPSSASEPIAYYVSRDVPVGASNLGLVQVPIESALTGPGSAISVVHAVIDDSLWDNTWDVVGLTCSDGTKFESATDLRARARTARQEARVGFLPNIVTTCLDAGAVHVVGFPSYRVTEIGLNTLYVGDQSFTTSPELLRRCRIALEGTRQLGDNLQVLPMQASALLVAADVTLALPPASYDLTGLRILLTGALVRYFKGKDAGFAYTRNGLLGAMRQVAPNIVSEVDFESPVADMGVMIGQSFPEILTRWYVDPINVKLTFQ